MSDAVDSTTISLFGNVAYGIYIAGTLNKFKTIISKNNGGTTGGIILSGNGHIIDTIVSADNLYTIEPYLCYGVFIKDFTYSDAAISVTLPWHVADYFAVLKFNSVVGDTRIYKAGAGVIYRETTVRHTASGCAWKISPINANLTAQVPLHLGIAKVACASGQLVTVSVWMRRTNTGLTMSLACRGGQISGVSSNVVSSMTAAADTWERVSISFTPSEAGVVEIEAWAYGGTTYSGYVDDMSVTQTGGPVKDDLLTMDYTYQGTPWVFVPGGEEAASPVPPGIFGLGLGLGLGLGGGNVPPWMMG
jgi:hypothetical protein